MSYLNMNLIKNMYLNIGIILALLTVQILTEECITPNNEKAECISIYSCRVLISALATEQEGATEFVRQSNCGGTGTNPMVCCGPSGNFVTRRNNSNNDSSHNKTQKINLLPTRRFCGYQHSDDYFRTTNITATITEIPWLAMIILQRRDPADTFKPICGGSLINTRYVLTAAACLQDEHAKPVAVHLGEYHMRNQTDCVKEPPFVEECSDPLAILGIEKIIPHPQYSNKNATNDIGLLRLNRTVFYTEYIRPLCLPLPGTIFAKVGDILTSSGWGISLTGNRGFVDIKKKSLSTLIDNTQCSMTYYSILNENHLCTIPVSETDIECGGDSGGPLVFSYRNQWHQEGIISFGKGCGTEYPGVYTRVVNYLNWILENIEK